LNEKRDIVIGLAGHVDHGKTCLIEALTGCNADRLPEERKRGMTIELGFASLEASEHRTISFVDVPGHVRFLSQMLSGIVGLDAVMLVVAADEGVMPQTREHLQILHLLGVEHLMVVVTKCDLVELSWQEMVREEVAKEVEQFTWQQVSYFFVSAKTRIGLQEIQMYLESIHTEREPESLELQDVRLCMDRVFQICGAGTVVTGTMREGQVSKGDTLMLYPKGRYVKVRGIQVHGREVSSAWKGQRVALNLTGIEFDEIHRGDVIATVDSMQKSSYVDVKLSLLPTSEFLIENHMRLHFYSGTMHGLCKVRCIGTEAIYPGETGYAQLCMEQPVVLKRKDCFVIRSYSPMETIGGGVVLEPLARKRKGKFLSDVSGLSERDTGGWFELACCYLQEEKERMVSRDFLSKKMGIANEVWKQDWLVLLQDTDVFVCQSEDEIWLWHIRTEEKMCKRLLQKLQAYHTQFPYREGCPLAQVYQEVFSSLERRQVLSYLQDLQEKGEVLLGAQTLSLPTHSVREREEYKRVRGTIQTLFGKDKQMWNLTNFAEILGDVSVEEIRPMLPWLEKENLLVCLTDEVFASRAWMDTVLHRMEQQFQMQSSISIVEMKEWFQLTRKEVRDLFAYTDRMKVTRKKSAESERDKYL
jgi:selenocysteine-specific elongation factor